MLDVPVPQIRTCAPVRMHYCT